MPYPDRFYPVVDSVAWVARLTQLGVGTIQLRAKNLNDADALKIVREALAVTRGTRTKLVVNDYWRAAIDAGARHLHLGQEDLADADLKAIRAAGLTLGVSTHDDEELAIGLAAKPDYVALGPIFPTTLKSMRFAPQGIPENQRMEEARRQHSAGCDRRHQVRARCRDFRRRRQFHRCRFRRHPERRPRCTGAAVAGSKRGGRVKNFHQRHSGAMRKHRTRNLAQQLRDSGSVRVPRPVRNDEINGGSP